MPTIGKFLFDKLLVWSKIGISKVCLLSSRVSAGLILPRAKTTFLVRFFSQWWWQWWCWWCLMMMVMGSMKMMIIFKDVISRKFPISSRFLTRGHSSGPHVFRWVNEYDTCNRDTCYQSIWYMQYRYLFSAQLKLRITKIMSTWFSDDDSAAADDGACCRWSWWWCWWLGWWGWQGWQEWQGPDDDDDDACKCDKSSPPVGWKKNNEEGHLL